MVYFLIMMLLVSFQPWLKLSGAVLGGLGIGLILASIVGHEKTIEK